MCQKEQRRGDSREVKKLWLKKNQRTRTKVHSLWTRSVIIIIIAVLVSGYTPLPSNNEHEHTLHTLMTILHNRKRDIFCFRYISYPYLRVHRRWKRVHRSSSSHRIAVDDTRVIHAFDMKIYKKKKKKITGKNADDIDDVLLDSPAFRTSHQQNRRREDINLTALLPRL